MKFKKKVFELIEDRFRTGISVGLEVHVASNFVAFHDPTVQAGSTCRQIFATPRTRFSGEIWPCPACLNKKGFSCR